MASKCPVQTVLSTDGTAVSLRCGLWSCQYCQIINARIWASRTKLQFADGGHFITLTQPGTVKSVKRAYQLLPKQWDTFRKTIQRECPDRWIYIAFVEGQPKRMYMPHFHIICNRPPMDRTGRQSLNTALVNMAVRSGFGYQAKYKAVVSGEAAAYVSKYASKDAPNMPKGFRRVRTSQGFPDLPLLPNAGLIFPKPSEKLTEYIMRVSDLSGIVADDLLDAYDRAKIEFNQQATKVLERAGRMSD